MKTLTTAVSNLLATTHGLEPVNIFAVQWVENGAEFLYADKEILDYSNGQIIPGAILEIGTLESIVKFESRGQSQAISITLSDTDGQIKDILNNHDIHARPAKIYQWFEGLSVSEKFLLYEGEISSNIEWSEGARTVRLDVVTELYAEEAGFSPEEGYFSHIPNDLIGKVWPLAFGTVQNVPATRLVAVPEGQTTSAMGVSDPTLQSEISRLTRLISDLEGQAIYYIYAGLQCAATATSYLWDSQQWLAYAAGCVTAYNAAVYEAENAESEAERTYYENVATAWRKEAEYASKMSSRCVSTYNQIMGYKETMESTLASIVLNKANAQEDKSTYQRELLLQLEYEKDSVEVIDGKLFPQNTEVTVEIGDAIYSGKFSGDTFTISSTSLPDFSGDLTQGFGFTFTQTGTKVRLLSENKIVYIANILPSTVTNVKAWYQGTESGTKILTYVPQNWYTVDQVDVGGYTVTAIIMDMPLSARDEGFDNDIYVTFTSSVGPNTVDIMKWLIETYTDLEVDDTSFDAVKTKLENYPSHFALLERKNVLDLLEDIAFQCRCAIWLSNRKFYLKYLSEDAAATSEITESDIEAGTLSIFTTFSDDIVTKYTARWRDDYAAEEDNIIVLRHNVNKYGIREREYDFYIYNIFDLVMKSASFWMVRYSNVWKKLRLKTELNKLAIDTFDVVNFNLTAGLIANTAIKGEVTALTYDSAGRSIDIEAWLPVKIGEMEQHIFALPAYIDANTIFPDHVDVTRQYVGGTSPGKDVNGDEFINDEDVRITYQSIGLNRGELTPGRIDWGQRYPSDLHQTTKPVPSHSRAGTASPAYVYIGPTYKDYTPTYGKLDPVLKPEDRTDEPETWEYPSQCFPGKVLSGSGSIYDVAVYKNGLNNIPETEEVTQLQIATGTTIPADTWVLVSLVYTKDEATDEYTAEYTMQVPVWL